jgi:hypothetical protein
LNWAKPVKGSYALTISAKNTAGLSGAGKYTLNISAPPTLAGATLTGTTSSPFTASVLATDPNASTLHYAMTGAPAGLSLSSGGALSWAKPVAGIYKLTISATDALGLSATAGVTLTIEGPPVLTASALTGYVASIFQATVAAKDPNASALSYAMNGAPAGMTLSSAGILTWPSPVAGVYHLTISAKDALGLSASAPCTLTVYGQPVLASANLIAQTTAAFSATVLAMDPNAGALSFSLSGAPSGMNISTTGVLTWAKPLKGSYRFTIYAKDALGFSGSATYTLTVS